MTRSIARLFVVLMISVVGIGAAAAVERPYIVVDLDSGKVLSERNPHQLWYPASVTKLMNAYVVFKAIKQGRVTPDTQVVVSKNALAEPPSKMGFKVGTVIDLKNAMLMMMVHSSNDIAVAIGETVGGSEANFVAEMNAEAARLGMGSTHFINPNGLPGPGQYTTARDLGVLARALWTEFPGYRSLFGVPAIRSGKRILKSANSLLERYPGTVGMKTGFICASGFNVVAAATRNGRTLAAVVLGSDNSKERAELAGRLLSDGFSRPSGFGPTVASFRGSSPIPYAIDMKGEICLRKDRGEHEADADKLAAVQSALVPKFKLMDPVEVTTLGIRKPDGTIKSGPVVTAEEGAPAKAKPSKKSAKKAAPKAAADTAASAADDDASGPTKLPQPAKKPVKKKQAAKSDNKGDDAAPATKASSKGKAAKPQTKAPAKLEVGVPFDSTDIAPLPDTPAPVTQ